MQKKIIIILLATLLGISLFLNGWLAHKVESIKNSQKAPTNLC